MKQQNQLSSAGKRNSSICLLLYSDLHNKTLTFVTGCIDVARAARKYVSLRILSNIYIWFSTYTPTVKFSEAGIEEISERSIRQDFTTFVRTNVLKRPEQQGTLFLASLLRYILNQFGAGGYKKFFDLSQANFTPNNEEKILKRTVFLHALRLLIFKFSTDIPDTFPALYTSETPVWF